MCIRDRYTEEVVTRSFEFLFLPSTFYVSNPQIYGPGPVDHTYIASTRYFFSAIADLEPRKDGLFYLTRRRYTAGNLDGRGIKYHMVWRSRINSLEEDRV